jgi:hypothetical protein
MNNNANEAKKSKVRSLITLVFEAGLFTTPVSYCKDLGFKSDYNDLVSSWYSSAPSGIHGDSTSNYATTASFQILSNSLLNIHATIRRHTLWATGSVVK